MPSFATSNDPTVRLAELDAAVVDAWLDYRDAIRDVPGPAYDRAEAAGWDRLQTELEQLAAERRSLVS